MVSFETMDVGRLVFVDLLKVSGYPNTPFTGNVMTDLVLYFFLPLVLILLIIYLMLARLFPTGYKGLRLLVGVAVFLFIVFMGYFGMIITLAGPYFTFLLFGLGLLMFILGHFKPGGGEARYRGGGQAAYAAGGAAASTQQPQQNLGGVTGVAKRVLELEFEIAEAEYQIKQAREAKAAPGSVQLKYSPFEMAKMKREHAQLVAILKKNPLEWAQYRKLKAERKILSHIKI